MATHYGGRFPQGWEGISQSDMRRDYHKQKQHVWNVYFDFEQLQGMRTQNFPKAGPSLGLQLSWLALQSLVLLNSPATRTAVCILPRSW